jgi:PAS domain S-box-containing protein
MKPRSKQKHPTINLQWYEDLAEIFPVGIFFTDAEGKCLQVNRAWCEIAGMPAEKALGRGWVRAIHPEDLERVTTLWHESIRHNQPFHAEYRFCTPQGKTTWVVGRASAKRTKDGTVEGYIGTITDIDKTRQALDELEQSSSRIRTIIAHMPVILFAFDHHGHLCAWNHEAERVTGYKASEMIGNPEAIYLLCPDPDYRREMLAAYRERGDDYRNWDWQLVAKDGTVKIITFSNIAKYYPIKGWANWGVGVDITSYRRAEHELCERVKELNFLFKLSMLSNQQNLNLDFFFQEVVELLPECWQYPEITSARIIYEDSIFSTERFAVTPWKLASSLHVQGHKAGLIEIYYSEERPAAAEGPFLIEERLLLDEVALQISRTISYMLARQDLALLDEMCAKNEQLENFSHTVSHDLKTPLTAISGFAELLSEQLARGNLAQARFCADRIAESTNRMEHRLDEILNLAKIGRTIGRSEEIDLKNLIETTLGMMTKRLTDLRIVVEVDAEFPKVLGDPIRLREVIENLLENAIRYIGSEPNLISIGCRRQGPEMIFYVKDNGLGIDPRHFESIFELFRRLNKTIDGHGLGLTISRRIIEAHGGRIWVESEGEGTGTCFCFTLGHVID